MNICRHSALIAALMAFGLQVSAPARSEESDTHEEHHPNLIALFVGITSEERRETGVALGIEYERRFNDRFGVGVLAEHTFGDIDITVYAVPFAYHAERWKVYVAPGIEDSDLGSESLVRIGAEYGFEFGAWEISPQLDVDFVDGESAFVLGVTYGKGF
jgi:hypothetical protein